MRQEIYEHHNEAQTALVAATAVAAAAAADVDAAGADDDAGGEGDVLEADPVDVAVPYGVLAHVLAIGQQCAPQRPVAVTTTAAHIVTSKSKAMAL